MIKTLESTYKQSLKPTLKLLFVFLFAAFLSLSCKKEDHGSKKVTIPIPHFDSGFVAKLEQADNLPAIEAGIEIKPEIQPSVTSATSLAKFLHQVRSSCLQQLQGQHPQFHFIGELKKGLFSIDTMRPEHGAVAQCIALQLSDFSFDFPDDDLSHHAQLAIVVTPEKHPENP